MDILAEILRVSKIVSLVIKNVISCIRAVNFSSCSKKTTFSTVRIKNTALIDPRYRRVYWVP